MKSYGVTIKMEPLQQCIDMVPFVFSVVVTFGSVSMNEILWVEHSN